MNYVKFSVIEVKKKPYRSKQLTIPLILRLNISTFEYSRILANAIKEQRKFNWILYPIVLLKRQFNFSDYCSHFNKLNIFRVDRDDLKFKYSETGFYLFIHRLLSTQNEITKQWQNDDATIQSKVPIKVQNVHNIKS